MLTLRETEEKEWESVRETQEEGDGVADRQTDTDSGRGRGNKTHPDLCGFHFQPFLLLLCFPEGFGGLGQLHLQNLVSVLNL